MSTPQPSKCAADANVSRMTFFNYFPTKERALDFWLSRWSYELTVLTARKNVGGRITPSTDSAFITSR